MAIPLAQEEHKELRKQIKKLKKSASLGQLDEAGTQVGLAVASAGVLGVGCGTNQQHSSHIAVWCALLRLPTAAPSCSR